MKAKNKHPSSPVCLYFLQYLLASCSDLIGTHSRPQTVHAECTAHDTSSLKACFYCLVLLQYRTQFRQFRSGQEGELAGAAGESENLLGEALDTSGSPGQDGAPEGDFAKP